MNLQVIDWELILTILAMYGAVGAWSVAALEWIKQLFNVPESYKGWAYPLVNFAIIVATVVGLHLVMPNTVWGGDLYRQMAIGIVGSWVTATGLVKRGNRLAERSAGGSLNKRNTGS